MIEIISSIFKKKEEKSSDLVPKGITRVTYPFNGYEDLSLRERYKVIGNAILENKMVMKKQ